MKFDLIYNDKELQRYLKKMLKRTDNLKPFMRETGAIVMTSVKKNFEVGGRYSTVGSIRGGSRKWQPLAVSTLFAGPKKKIVGKRGRFRKSFQKSLANRKILFQQGRLFGSIKFQARNKEVKIGPDNLPYAAIQNFGGKIEKSVSVKQHTRLITQAFGKKLSPEKSNLGIFATIGPHKRQMNLTIPGRPYLVIQSEDNIEILRAAKRHFEKR